MAIEIPISNLTAISGSTQPANGKDETTQITYTLWQMGDAGSFSEALPLGVTQASNLSLKIVEWTPGVALKHKWQAVVTLIRPGTHKPTEAVVTETFSTEYTSSADANKSAIRTLAISDGNDINTTAIQSGDLISVQLSRIAASGSEDGNAIRVPDIRLVIGGASLVAISSCLGHVGTIIDRVLRAANDIRQGFSDQAMVLDWINMCLSDIASEGLWTGYELMDLTAATTDYDLTVLPAFSGIIRPFDPVIWAATGDVVRQCTSYGDFMKYAQQQATGDRPYWWFWNNGTMSVTPQPTASTSDALGVPFTYLPTDRGCDASYDLPAIPRTALNCFVYYCLRELAAYDQTNPRTDSRWARYNQLYETEKAKLQEANTSSSFAARPHGRTR